MAIKILPPYELLRSLLDYDPETGVTRWRERSAEYCGHENTAKFFNENYAGKEVGYKTARGYVEMTLGSRYFLMHRIIWKWMTGEEPPPIIDHINQVQDDNRWANLRESDTTRNVANSNIKGRKHKRGVFENKDGTFTARVQVVHTTNLGTYNSVAEAEAAVAKYRGI